MAVDDSTEDEAKEPVSDSVREGEVIIPADGSEEGPASPYGNLLVPLVVVPAMIVVVVILVYTLVGAITGEEASLDENLHRVLHGGSNEREQAAFALVAQLAENDRARVNGAELPWELSNDLAPNLAGALEGLGEDEAQMRYVISSALYHLGDPAGLEGMRQILALGEDADPDGRLKFHALYCIGPRGEPETFEDVRAFLESEDEGLRILSAGFLRFYPRELAIPALKGVLGDHDLAVRLNAAISLSWLGDPAGAMLLKDGAGREIYEAERSRDPREYARPEVVRENRVRALEALARLGREGDRALFEELASGDEDLQVREAAMKALGNEK